MVLQYTLEYMCLFRFWFPQSLCLDGVLLCHMVTFQIYLFSYTVVSVFSHSIQSLSHVQLLETPWTAACQASLSVTKQHIKTHVHESMSCSNSYPLSQWCHPTISSSVISFSYHLQSFPALGSFPVSQFFSSVAKVLEFQLQHQFSQWIFRTNFL